MISHEDLAKFHLEYLNFRGWPEPDSFVVLEGLGRKVFFEIERAEVAIPNSILQAMDRVYMCRSSAHARVEKMDEGVPYFEAYAAEVGPWTHVVDAIMVDGKVWVRR